MKKTIVLILVFQLLLMGIELCVALPPFTAFLLWAAPYIGVLALLVVPNVRWWFPIGDFKWVKVWRARVPWRSAFVGPWRWYPHVPSAEAAPEEWQQVRRECLQALVAAVIAFLGLLLRVGVSIAQVSYRG